MTGKVKKFEKRLQRKLHLRRGGGGGGRARSLHPPPRSAPDLTGPVCGPLLTFSFNNQL